VLSAEPPIDLLFTDIRMPGRLTGWDVAEQARTLRPGLPVIYATGYSEDAPRLVPGARFFKKPYRAIAIIDAARELGVSPPAP
jgi:CheY-like chemotaxis protein